MSKQPSPDLGQLQADLEDYTLHLRQATKAKLKADQNYEECLSLHEGARVNLNAGLAAVKAAATVPNPYAS